MHQAKDCMKSLHHPGSEDDCRAAEGSRKWRSVERPFCHFSVNDYRAIREVDFMDEQPDRDDILRIAGLAGLHLPAPYEAELVDAYQHVRRLVTLLPRPRSRSDEPAHTFDPEKFRPASG
jgi:hypothetical protein